MDTMDDTDAEIGYKIVLEFDSFSKVGEFLADLEAWQAYKAIRSEKKENDRRGIHTRESHRRARDFREQHPLIPYRECFKIANAKN